ncbi:hypothetical protein LK07_13000 [Streptomyces pluripotens]|uniref:Uncharacterized protein n=1 Tax=Streptomyces pluripotens TaxID=1355015 RepID=A0A221NXW7_9ACTN|nr:hypothetical protein LK07_13000 [Streptomyces pluripotens]
MAQQLEQQQQLQRARAAPWDPAVRVVVAKFASMPLSTPAHTRDVNLMPGMWDMFHLIRFISQVNGLLIGAQGHMAHNRARTAARNAIERQGVLLRTEIRTGSRAGSRTEGADPSGRLGVGVYGDLNTFRMALVPQSE